MIFNPSLSHVNSVCSEVSNLQLCLTFLDFFGRKLKKEKCFACCRILHIIGVSTSNCHLFKYEKRWLVLLCLSVQVTAPAGSNQRP